MEMRNLSVLLKHYAQDVEISLVRDPSESEFLSLIVKTNHQQEVHILLDGTGDVFWNGQRLVLEDLPIDVN